MHDSGDTGVDSKRVSVCLPEFRFGRQAEATNTKRARQRQILSRMTHFRARPNYGFVGFPCRIVGKRGAIMAQPTAPD